MDKSKSGRGLPKKAPLTSEGELPVTTAGKRLFSEGMTESNPIKSAAGAALTSVGGTVEGVRDAVNKVGKKLGMPRPK